MYEYITDYEEPICDDCFAPICDECSGVTFQACTPCATMCAKLIKKGYL